MEMQRLFRPAKFIRKMVDVIPPRSDTEPTMMVLEPFEREIKHIMKLALLGLREVHEKCLVYCGMFTPRANGAETSLYEQTSR
jgi:hypothetical protein